MNMLRLRWFACVALAGVLAWSPAARADEIDQLYEQGQAAFEKQDFATAHAKLSAVWAARQSYDIATVLAQAEAQLGKDRDAAEHLAYAVAHFPVSAKTELRMQVEAMLKEARAKVGAVRVKVTPETAAVTVNGRSAAATDRSVPIFVEPGKVTIEATAPGFVGRRRTIDVAKGGEVEVVLALDKEAPPPRSILGPAIAFGAGGAGLVVGIITGAVAIAKFDDFEKACGPQLRCPNSLQADVDAGRTLGHVSTAGFVVAGVGAAVGATLLLLPMSSKPSANVGVVVGPAFTGVKGMF